MKIATPELRRTENFASVTACLIGTLWRGALLYTLLWSMCLGGNCGIWPEPALAAPVQTARVTSVSTTATTGISVECSYPSIGSFRVRQGVTTTIDLGVGALFAGSAPLMASRLLAYAD